MHSLLSKLITWRIGLILALLVMFSGGAMAAAKKVIFFTASKVPTAAEQAKINSLKAFNQLPYAIVVVNAKKATSPTMTADYVAGSVPAAYRDGGIDGPTVYPYYNLASPPVTAIAGGGTVTFVAPDGGT